MTKDIKMIKGSDEVIVNENSIAKFERLGYKTNDGSKKIVERTQFKKPEIKINKENK
mgnify:CR=1 FL=1|jgi:hypothetical protein